MAGTFWVLLAVAVVAVVGIVAGGAVRRAWGVQRVSHEHAVLTWCTRNGHAYGIHGTGWRCGSCGNYVARHEGERYGRTEDGRIDRRRVDRREDRVAA